MKRIFSFLSPQLSSTGSAAIILSLALMLLAAFLMTRVTKLLKLPNVSAYILTGILIGPYGLKLIPFSVAEGMDFLTDIALAIIAFGVGKYLKFAKLKEAGGKVAVITAGESFCTALLVFFTMGFLFGLPLDFSLLLGVIAAVTAPASTLMTIRQYKAKGELVDLLLPVIALDNAIALIAFSLALAVMSRGESFAPAGGFSWHLLLLPLGLNLAAILVGAGLGLGLKRLICQRRTPDNRLMLAIGLLLVLTGLCQAFGISPFLSAMALGIAYVNAGGRESLFTQMDGFSPPILTMFFVLSGMGLDISLLAGAGLLGLTYFFLRTAGKLAGACLGTHLCRLAPPTKKYLGLALLPQAGVSIGLAMTARRLLPSDSGALLSVIVLFAAVLYEMTGPVLAKLALERSGCICPEPAKEEQPCPSLFEQQ